MADATIDELQVENSDLKKKQADLEHTILSGKEKYSCLLKEVQTYRSLLEVEENVQGHQQLLRHRLQRRQNMVKNRLKKSPMKSHPPRKMPTPAVRSCKLIIHCT